MKIISVSVMAIQLPLRRPFIVAYETYETMPTIIVKVQTDTGLVGYGEATPDQHVTGETWESTYAVLTKVLGPLMLDEHPFNIERIHARMNDALYRCPAAKAGIDIACYDLMGKMSAQPVYRLLGGLYHDSLTVPYVLSIREPEAMAQEAADAVANGYDSIKIKVGLHRDTDIERVRAVRKAVGKSVKIRVDANQGWRNRSDTLYVLQRIEDCDIDWIEQPVTADDLVALADVRRQTILLVMVDEGLHDLRDMRQVIALGAADRINIKLMKCGGLYPALKLVSQAEMAGMECQIGSMVESSVATAAGAHLSVAKKNITSNEMVGPLMFTKDIGALHYEGSRLHLCDKPGLGIEVDEQTLAEMVCMNETIDGK